MKKSRSATVSGGNIGLFPSFGIIEPGGPHKQFYRTPENDMADLEKMDPKHKARRLHLLGYRKYEKELKKYIGKRHHCKYCYGDRFYDIDWFDGVIDCRNCGYHIDSIELLIGLMVDEHIIPDEPESQRLPSYHL